MSPKPLSLGTRRRIVSLTVMLLALGALACGKQNNGLKGTWERMEETPPQRFLHTAVWTGDRMLVWGGYEPSALGYVIKSAGMSYDPKTNKWTDIAADGAPTARAQHSAV